MHNVIVFSLALCKVPQVALVNVRHRFEWAERARPSQLVEISNDPAKRHDAQTSNSCAQQIASVLPLYDHASTAFAPLCAPKLQRPVLDLYKPRQAVLGSDE